MQAGRHWRKDHEWRRWRRYRRHRGDWLDHHVWWVTCHSRWRPIHPGGFRLYSKQVVVEHTAGNVSLTVGVIDPLLEPRYLDANVWLDKVLATELNESIFHCSSVATGMPGIAAIGRKASREM